MYQFKTDKKITVEIFLYYESVMKALFLYFGYFPEHSGVYKKIQSQ